MTDTRVGAEIVEVLRGTSTPATRVGGEFVSVLRSQTAPATRAGTVFVAVMRHRYQHVRSVGGPSGTGQTDLYIKDSSGSWSPVTAVDQVH